MTQTKKVQNVIKAWSMFHIIEQNEILTFR